MVAARPTGRKRHGKCASALIARGSMSKTMRRLVDGAAAVTSESRKLWKAAHIPRSLRKSEHYWQGRRRSNKLCPRRTTRTPRCHRRFRSARCSYGAVGHGRLHRTLPPRRKSARWHQQMIHTLMYVEGRSATQQKWTPRRCVPSKWTNSCEIPSKKWRRNQGMAQKYDVLSVFCKASGLLTDGSVWRHARKLLLSGENCVEECLT